MKGLEYLILAARELKEQHIELRWCIGGEGPLAEHLAAMIAEQQLEGTVELVGFVDDIPDFVGGLDLFVLPSVSTEGLPRR